jgi:hypothetical protein
MWMLVLVAAHLLVPFAAVATLLVAAFSVTMFVRLKPAAAPASGHAPFVQPGSPPSGEPPRS